MPRQFFKEPADPAPDAVRLGRRYRPLRSETPVKHVKFKGEAGRDLALQINAKVFLERRRARDITVNDILLRLLRRGLHAEAQDKST